MKSEFRQCIIQNKIGLLSNAQLVQIADTYILEHDMFPDWLIKISLGENLERETSLDLILEPINVKDCKILASELLSLYQKGKIDVQLLGDISHELCLLLDYNSDAFHSFIWISDEVYLRDQGYKSVNHLDENIKKMLREVMDL